MENNISDHYIEPYAGGSAIALHLLFNKYVKKVTINDMDRSIYAFWYSILNNTKKFLNIVPNVLSSCLALLLFYDYEDIHEGDQYERNLFSHHLQ